jgi:hypothetical protein
MDDKNKGGNGAGNDDDKNKGNGGGAGNGNDNGGQGGDDKNVSIPKHRFDEVNQEARELKQWKEQREKEDREREEKKLTDEKKFQELADKHKSEAEKARNEVRSIRTQSAIERAAMKAGIKDTDAAYKLLDMSKISVKDDGTIEGVDTAIEELLKARPYLKSEGGSGSPDNIGGGSNPEGDKTGQTYALSWVRKQWGNVAWTREKHAEYGNITGAEFLNKIEKEGKIDRTK